jgi:hypothetical protein
VRPFNSDFFILKEDKLDVNRAKGEDEAGAAQSFRFEKKYGPIKVTHCQKKRESSGMHHTYIN